jgi:hypothetical protein
MFSRLLIPLACAALAGQPTSARAAARLLEHPLHAPVALASGSLGPRVVELALAAEPTGPGADFDLLGEPPPPPPSDAGRMRTRRFMLKTHQALGIGLVAAQVSNTVVGQLNYGDKFGSANNTNRYAELHSATAWTNLGLFALTGGVALFAPSPAGKTDAGYDRVKLHKIAMIAATAGMLAQGGLGLYTASREGFENQSSIAKVHLALGYATTAALLAGVGFIVF